MMGWEGTLRPPAGVAVTFSPIPACFRVMMCLTWNDAFISTYFGRACKQIIKVLSSVSRG
jgi:hypothetical protein